MTPDKNFKMKSSFKHQIALMKGNAHEKGQFKRMMIDAQLHEEAARRASLKSKDYGSKSTTKNTHSKEGIALD